MPALDIRPFDDSALDGAATLLAARHRAQRASEPLLDARFESPAVASREIEALWARDGASGAVARSDGRVVGFLLGTPRRDDVWGPSAWVEVAGHAAERAEGVRDLYAAAAARWLAEGLTYHYAVVPATDALLVDAWFRLGFGQQQAYGVRPAAADCPPAGVSGVTLRRATTGDLDDLAGLDLALPQHQALAPVFAAGQVLSLAEARADWAETLADAAGATFVAELDGRIVGSAFGCPVERSSAHSGLARPAAAGLLAFAAVLPAARGLGVGQLLGAAVVRWCAAVGYRTVVTDWRVTNLLSSRAWPRLGFRPTFYRLHRRL